MVALRTAIEMAAQRRRAAARDSAEHAPVLTGQPGAVPPEKRLAVSSDDIGHLKGWRGHRFCSRRERCAMSGLEMAIASSGFATACKCRRDRCR